MGWLQPFGTVDVRMIRKYVNVDGMGMETLCEVNTTPTGHDEDKIKHTFPDPIAQVLREWS